MSAWEAECDSLQTNPMQFKSDRTWNGLADVATPNLTGLVSLCKTESALNNVWADGNRTRNPVLKQNDRIKTSAR